MAPIFSNPNKGLELKSCFISEKAIGTGGIYSSSGGGFGVFEFINLTTYPISLYLLSVIGAILLTKDIF